MMLVGRVAGEDPAERPSPCGVDGREPGGVSSPQRTDIAREGGCPLPALPLLVCRTGCWMMEDDKLDALLLSDLAL